MVCREKGQTSVIQFMLMHEEYPEMRVVQKKSKEDRFALGNCVVNAAGWAR